MLLIIGQYVLLAFVVIYATSKLSYYVDELDKKTHISGALIGGVLLATITSMPEFITSITSTMALNEPSLAFGNVFGSNIFNVVILAVADLLFLKQMFFNKVKTQRTTNAFVIVMYIIFMFPLLISGFTGLDYGSFTLNILLTFNLISLLIVILYVFSIRSMNNDETEQSEEGSDLTYKKIGLMFFLWAVVVVLSSYFVTIVADQLGDALNLGASFAGAIFLGVATSLPELTAVMTLMKLRNHEAALGNIIGSNVFNMTIISVVDILNVNDDIFNELVTNTEARENVSYLLILGLINSIILMLALLRKRSINKITYVLPSVLILIAYLVYIGLSV
ncbi:sodium:calcium antiporter [Candidatus Xianfuyuplasma coldseepsis]|uniref:Sodium:calcium antiporter n=1 Tax=Candidatus Xianfuyuplasma coldseepsis TaxID=2782163 RepID=A0A7L7KNH0_9MOLU|nr:sodium:calcium antiporter [Xianfuyuplasma coldseepsis]QMS84271.1 sodium:calcium antiporter [Xianfuyuplasma coldseepsis]